MSGPRLATGAAAEIVHEQVTAGYRYRVALTPMGYLVTARSRDVLGLAITEQWLHREKETAMACVHAVVASHVAWGAMGKAHANGALSAMEAATAHHKAICDKLDDHPLVGREVQDLRESLMPDAGS